MKQRLKVPAGMFGSEFELCRALITSARVAGYQAHPDCGEWDALVVCRETGDQIGVHSAMRPNVEVLNSCLIDEHGSGPEVHAVIVPIATDAFMHVANRLKVHVLQGVYLDQLELADVFKLAQRWHHPVREWAPEVEMCLPTDGPSPRRTPWKTSAVKLCLLARKKGFVTREDVKEHKLDLQWWLDQKNGRLLEPHIGDDGQLHRGEFRLRDSSSPMVPDLRWPEIAESLEQEALKAAAAVDEAAAQSKLKGPRLRTKRAAQAPRPTMIPPPSDESGMTPLASLAAAAGNEQYFDEGRRVSSGK